MRIHIISIIIHFLLLDLFIIRIRILYIKIVIYITYAKVIVIMHVSINNRIYK